MTDQPAPRPAPKWGKALVTRWNTDVYFIIKQGLRKWYLMFLPNVRSIKRLCYKEVCTELVYTVNGKFLNRKKAKATLTIRAEKGGKTDNTKWRDSKLKSEVEVSTTLIQSVFFFSVFSSSCYWQFLVTLFVLHSASRLPHSTPRTPHSTPSILGTT